MTDMFEYGCESLDNFSRRHPELDSKITIVPLVFFFELLQLDNFAGISHGIACFGSLATLIHGIVKTVKYLSQSHRISTDRASAVFF